MSARSGPTGSRSATARPAIALARRRDRELLHADGEWQEDVWTAIREEVSRDRPIWELQKLLDETDTAVDGFVHRRVGVRGELSLEHAFRMLSLVLDAEPVRTAFYGVILDDDSLESLALEYLEQVLPGDVRTRLWPFIGDVSAVQRDRAIRPMGDVVSDLLQSGATLFGGELECRALREALGDTLGDTLETEDD